MDEQQDKDRKRLMEMMGRIRQAFPQYGFLLGVYELDTGQAWGWTNLKDATPLADYLARNEKNALLVRDVLRN